MKRRAYDTRAHQATQPGAYPRCYRVRNTPRGAVVRTISTAINYPPRVLLRVDLRTAGKKGNRRKREEKEMKKKKKSKGTRNTSKKR